MRQLAYFRLRTHVYKGSYWVGSRGVERPLQARYIPGHTAIAPSGLGVRRVFVRAVGMVGDTLVIHLEPLDG